MDVDPRLVEGYVAFMEASDLLQQLMQDQLRRDGGISYLQFVILRQLADRDDGRVRMTDLARDVVHSRSGLTYQVRVLETAGLVARVAAEADDRSVEVELTAQGRSVLDRVMPGHVAAVAAGLLEPLTAEGATAFAETMVTIRDHLRVAATPLLTRQRRRER